MNEVVEITCTNGFKTIVNRKDLNFAIIDNDGCHINFGFGQVVTNHTSHDVIRMIDDNEIFNTSENDLLIIKRNTIRMIAENLEGFRVIMTTVPSRYSENGETYAFKLIDTFQEIKQKVLVH